MMESFLPPPDDWLVAPARAQPGRTVALLGGDGIGPEVTEVAATCMVATGAPLELVRPPHANTFPAESKEICRRADAILFGACDKASIPVLRFLRWELDTFANLRPVMTLPGVPARTGSVGTRLVIVRELSEGLYPSREGELADLNRHWPEFRDRMGRPLPKAGKFALRVITEDAVRRVARCAGELAAARRGRVCVVTKANVLLQTDGLFLEVAREELARFSGVTCDHLYVDDAARRLVTSPERFDVILTSNLFGDILSDVAAEAMGGLAMAPSAALGASNAYFEPVHGSAPDIAGQGVANPSGAILSAAMLLRYLGHSDAARRLIQALVNTIAKGVRTPDLGGSARSQDVCDAVCGFLR